MTLAAQKQIIDQITATTSVLTNPWLNVAKVFLYELTDINSNDSSDPENCFGVLFSSGNAKPAWASVRNSN